MVGLRLVLDLGCFRVLVCIDYVGLVLVICLWICGLVCWVWCDMCFWDFWALATVIVLVTRRSLCLWLVFWFGCGSLWLFVWMRWL